MDYNFLIKDLNKKPTQKLIGTDKGLAQIGDGIVNFTYSIAKSIILTRSSNFNNCIRTGKKVSKIILSNALKNAGMRGFARNRADAHDIADTAEAIVAYVWLNNDMSMEQMIDFLADHLNGNLYDRKEEIELATAAFTRLLAHLKQFLPEN